MAKPCAVVDVVGAERAPGHLLENEILLTRGTCRTQARKSVGAVLGLDLIESFCREGNCLIPTCRFERAILAATAHQRLRQTVGMMNEVHTETTHRLPILASETSDGLTATTRPISVSNSMAQPTPQ